MTQGEFVAAGRVDNLRRRARAIFLQPGAGAVVAAVSVFAFFAISADFFLTVAVWSNIGQLSAELGILAVGVTVLMIAGEFDLSVGSVFGFISGIAVILLNTGMPAIGAILIALSAAAAIGTLNGYLVTTLGVHSLIITLGGLMFYRALLLVVTEGFPIPIEVDRGFFDIFAARPGGLTIAWLWFIITVAVAQVLVFTTREGNWIFASGGNPLAARELGVPVRMVKIRAFALTSTLAAFAGIVQLARFNTVDALRGTQLELEAILAAVVGGAALTGGHGSIVGTAMGVLMLAMMKQGFILMGIPSYFFRAAIGVLLIVAATVNIYLRRKAEA